MKQIIMKRIEPDDFSKIVRPMSEEEIAAFDAHGSGPVHDELRARYDDHLRSYTHLWPEQAFAAAFRSLSFGARDELRAEESGEAQAREAEDAARRQAVLRGSTSARSISPPWRKSRSKGALPRYRKVSRT